MYDHKEQKKINSEDYNKNMGLPEIFSPSTMSNNENAKTSKMEPHGVSPLPKT